MSDLKPCPFCGKNEHLMKDHQEGTIRHPAYRIVCDWCGASSGFTDTDCVEGWNTRTTDALEKETAEIKNNVISMMMWLEREYQKVGVVDLRELGRFIALNFPHVVVERERRAALKQGADNDKG